MRLRTSFITIFVIIILAVMLVLRATGSLSHNAVPPTNTPSDQVTPVERIEGQIDARTHISTTIEAVMTQETLLQDGAVILDGHCTQCHMAKELEQIKQAHTDWEKALEKMETFGVKLDKNEKIVLLDYLAGAEQP